MKHYKKEWFQFVKEGTIIYITIGLDPESNYKLTTRFVGIDEKAQFSTILSAGIEEKPIKTWYSETLEDAVNVHEEAARNSKENPEEYLKS